MTGLVAVAFLIFAGFTDDNHLFWKAIAFAAVFALLDIAAEIGGSRKASRRGSGVSR